MVVSDSFSFTSVYKLRWVQVELDVAECLTPLLQMCQSFSDSYFIFNSFLRLFGIICHGIERRLFLLWVEAIWHSVLKELVVVPVESCVSLCQKLLKWTSLMGESYLRLDVGTMRRLIWSN